MPCARGWVGDRDRDTQTRAHAHPTPPHPYPTSCPFLSSYFPRKEKRKKSDLRVFVCVCVRVCVLLVYFQSGYQVEFLPLYLPSRAPAPPNNPNARRDPQVSEPVFITTEEFGPYRRRGNNVDPGGQYITFCYVGQIPADAVRLPCHPRLTSVFFLFLFNTLIRSAKNRRACLMRNITSVRCSSSTRHCHYFQVLRRTSLRSLTFFGGRPSKSSRSFVKPTIFTAHDVIPVVALQRQKGRIANVKQVLTNRRFDRNHSCPSPLIVLSHV